MMVNMRKKGYYAFNPGSLLFRSSWISGLEFHEYKMEMRLTCAGFELEFT